MSNTDHAKEAYDDMPVASIIALNEAANFLAQAPDASERLQYVSYTIVKYLKGEEPSLDRAFGGKSGNGITVVRHEETLEASAAVETDGQRWVAAAIELLQSVPVAEDKPIQALPQPLVEAVKSDVSEARIEAPPSPVEKIVIATTSSISQQPSRKTPAAPIAAVVAVLVIALGVGGYFRIKEKSLTNVVESAGARSASIDVVTSEPVDTPVIAEVPPPVPAPLPGHPPVVSPAMKRAPPPQRSVQLAIPAKESEVYQVAVDPAQSRVPGQVDAPPRQAPFRLSLTLTPLTVQKSIDEQYNERAAIECRAGFFGLFCREAMKLKLCSGKWTDDPLPGQTLCKQKSTQKL